MNLLLPSQFSPLDGVRHTAGSGDPEDDRGRVQESCPQVSLGTFKDSTHIGHFWSSVVLAIPPHWAEDNVLSLLSVPQWWPASSSRCTLMAG